MKTYGIVGWPLEHSFSKKYFEEKFAALGLGDHRYCNFPIRDISELPEIIAAHPDLQGFNVTIPYKKDVIAFLDSVSPEATAIGAVNCVKISGGKLTGYNTDAHGFGKGLAGLIGDRRPKALVLGTGGASNAVRYVLEQTGIDYRMVSRTETTGTIAYSHLTPEIVKNHKLIVNTTPLGMWPDTGSKPAIPYECVGPDHFLYDLVYNPALTAFLAEGQRRGAAILNGEKMLYAQAEYSFRIWTGDIDS